MVRKMQSPYMRWAKSNFHARYNLANSGVMNYKLSQLPLRIEDIELTGGHYYGYPPLMAELEKKYAIRQENIFTTLGASFANFAVLSALFERDAEILIENPTYELLISAAEHIGYRVKRFQRRFEESFAIDPASLGKELTSKTKLIILTNLHNPSSVYTDETILAELRNVAGSVGAYVMVDEAYLDSAFNLSPRSSFHLGNSFIVTSSLTKVYGLSGIRCGFVFAESALIQKIWLMNDLYYVKHAYAAEQLAVIALKNLGTITGWAKGILEKNHREMNQFLSRHQDLSAVVPGLGTTLFIRSEKIDGDRLSDMLIGRYETAVTPGRFFGVPQFFRVGMGCDPAEFAEGLSRIDTALNSL